MTAPDPFLVGDRWPEVRIGGPHAAEVAQALDRWMAHLGEHGAAGRAQALKPLLLRLEYAAARWRRAEAESASFPRESAGGESAKAVAPSTHAEWVTTAEASAMTGLTRQYLAGLARRHEIEARRDGRDWMLSGADVRELARRRAS